jgi:hypothetical protein
VSCNTSGATSPSSRTRSDTQAEQPTPGLRDEEQPARHGNALVADRRRAWNSIANVALLRLPRCDSDGAELAPTTSSHAPTSCLCTGCHRSGRSGASLVAHPGAAPLTAARLVRHDAVAATTSARRVSGDLTFGVQRVLSSWRRRPPAIWLSGSTFSTFWNASRA